MNSADRELFSTVYLETTYKSACETKVGKGI